MGERQCVACSSPSPGPAKRLYYQHRDFGPFFPILEEQREKANNFLFSAGRAVVCTGCANHLLRQWSAYEQKWTPLPRRTYTLRSDERNAKKNSMSSELSHNTYNSSTLRSNQKAPSQNKLLQALNQDGYSNNVPFPPSFITEDPSPFRRAVKRVTKQNTRVLSDTSKISDVIDAVMNQNHLAKHNLQSNSLENSPENQMLPRKKTPLALLNLPHDELRSKVREELQENVEVMIRKLAEIQHIENMRRYEHELQEAAQRICRAQDREGDIDRMCRNLKRQLQEELTFRDITRVLRDDELTKVRSANAAIQTSEPVLINNGIESITAARKAGSEWKGRTKKHRSRKEATSPQGRPQTPLRTHSETLPRDIIKDPKLQPRSAQNLDSVLRELEQEREWRKKTEKAITRQQEMINELRKGIQDDVQRMIKEQNYRYQELKETLTARDKPSKTEQKRKATPIERGAERRTDPPPWRLGSGNHVIRDDDNDHDETNGDDNSHDEDSSPATPEFYIN